MRISVGKSRKDLNWQVRDISWDDLCTRLSKTWRTHETTNEYKSMNKIEKDAAKDVGGFVGGVIEGGRRIGNNIKSRSLITLDADYANPGMWEDITLLYNYTMCCYSTHSHTPNLPRLRYVIPLDREVSVEEYEPLARQIAKDFDIEVFDSTTYEASRLMYWPSTSSDGEFVFKRQDGDILCADNILHRYKNWKDSIEWPLADREQKVHLKRAAQQGAPETKPGIVGVFCRAYDIDTAIDEFLSDTYVPCDEPNRYTYALGSTSAGVVLYENGKFAYSHHATDPAGGQLCNAFDLVRLHKFSALDAESDPETPINRMPSYLAMVDFAMQIDAVKQLVVQEKIKAAREDFQVEDWKEVPTTNKKGEILMTQPNVEIILRNDPNLKGKIAFNDFSQKIVITNDLPWRLCSDRINGTAWSDTDDSALRGYLEKTYGLRNVQITEDALKVVASEYSFHPIRKYLNGLKWDGVPRAETLFVDYLGADNDIYTRAVTKKWLAAAVARVMEPGCKFDYLVVLVGNQGIGKSLLAKKLGKYWFSDTFITVAGKTSFDQLSGVWIIEMGELSAMKRSDIESVKHYLSKQEDIYRKAYDRRPGVYPRQCVFYGSTNESDFLKDRTGNRRFWPIRVRQTDKVFKLKDDIIDQIWAEALQIYKAGEQLYLTPELEGLALDKQEAYMEDNPKLGMIEEYLERPLPENWEELGPSERKDFIQGYLKVDVPLTYQRQIVCIQEILAELFGMYVSNIPLYTIKEYHNLLKAIKGWEKLEKRQRTIYGLQTVYQKIPEDN